MAGQGVAQQRQAEGGERSLRLRRRVVKIDRDSLTLRLGGGNRPVDQAHAAKLQHRLVESAHAAAEAAREYQGQNGRLMSGHGRRSRMDKDANGA